MGRALGRPVLLSGGPGPQPLLGAVCPPPSRAEALALDPQAAGLNRALGWVCRACSSWGSTQDRWGPGAPGGQLQAVSGDLGGFHPAERGGEAPGARPSAHTSSSPRHSWSRLPRPEQEMQALVPRGPEEGLVSVWPVSHMAL